MRQSQDELSFSKRGISLVGQEMFRLLDKAKALESQGRHINHLELGDPKNAKGAKNYPPGRVINKTIESLLHSNVGYSSSLGVMPLRKAIAEYVSRSSVRSFTYENTAISPANMLIFQLVDLICNPGDIVGLFAPYFPSYLAACNYVNTDTRCFELSIEDGFRLTLEKIDEAFLNPPKLLIINSANNPTGAVYGRKELEYLVKRAREAGSWIVSDETYGLLTYTKKFHSMSAFDYERLVIISSFSKVFNIPGYRVGYALADRRVIEKIGLSSSTMYSCLPVFTQEGVLDGLGILDEFSNDRRKFYKRISDRCVKIISKSPSLSCISPEAAFYLFIDLSRLNIDGAEFSQILLEEYNTAITPGASFGCRQFVRASFCGSANDVKDGLEKIVELADRIAGRR